MKTLNLIAVFGLFLASCQVAGPALSPSEGTLRITLPGVAEARLLDTNADENIATVDLTVKDAETSEVVFSQSFTAGSTASLSLAPDAYTLEAAAKNTSSVVLADGTANFSITAGQTTALSLTLLLAEGPGTLTIDAALDALNWTPAVRQVKVYSDMDAYIAGIPVLFTLPLVDLDPAASSLWRAEKTDLAAGIYVVALELSDASGTTRRAFETARILPSAQTKGGLDLEYREADSSLGLSLKMEPAVSTLVLVDPEPDPDPEPEPDPDYSIRDTLGAQYTPTKTVFRIWSPDASDVKVVLDGFTHSLSKRADFAGYTDIYEVEVAGDWRLKEYQFRINGKGVRDPYGAMVKPGTNWNIVMDMVRASTQPTGGWAARPVFQNREDAVIYEVHVRDFTIDPSWNGPENKRGKFLGMVHPGTTHNGKPTGLDHLIDLGVTHVQLLPPYDFATAQYNWGYDPVNYNVPEDQYSETPTDYENRVKEFRTLVNEFHKAGIRVVMDVVYNHTYGNEMFQDITNKYYTGNNDSGTGNGINTGVPMVSRMIRDSLEYWVREYNIDGYRFDLIGIFHWSAVKHWGEYLNVQTFADRNLLMYGEPWNGYWPDPIESQKVRLGTVPHLASGHVGVFNGQYREAIKGNNDGVSRGYMFNNGVGQWWGAIPVGMRGSFKFNQNVESLPNLWDSMFTLDPEQTVNYISAHDNFGLWDKVYLSLSSNVTQNSSHQVLSLSPPVSLDYPIRVVKFGVGMVLTSQGIPFLHAGDEFLRTKTNNENMTDPNAWNYGQHGGTHNTYNSPDSFNSIKWGRRSTYEGVYTYHRDLIAFRAANPGLRLTTWEQVRDRMKTRVNLGTNSLGSFIQNDADLPANAFVSEIDNDGNAGNGYELVLVYNSGNNFNVSLPPGTWHRVFDINGAVNAPVSSPAAVEGTAVTIFKKQ